FQNRRAKWRKTQKQRDKGKKPATCGVQSSPCTEPGSGRDHPVQTGQMGSSILSGQSILDNQSLLANQSILADQSILANQSILAGEAMLTRTPYGINRSLHGDHNGQVQTSRSVLIRQSTLPGQSMTPGPLYGLNHNQRDTSYSFPSELAFLYAAQGYDWLTRMRYNNTPGQDVTLRNHEKLTENVNIDTMMRHHRHLTFGTAFMPLPNDITHYSLMDLRKKARMHRL
ncbi:unnamed protein product, partial [Owenia fusiformis]